jgi:hypothetical protein
MELQHTELQSLHYLDSVSKPVQSFKVRKKREKYFNRTITIRVNQDMDSLMDYYVAKCKDEFGAKLFDSKSHFVKCSIMKQIRELDNF